MILFSDSISLGVVGIIYQWLFKHRWTFAQRWSICFYDGGHFIRMCTQRRAVDSSCTTVDSLLALITDIEHQREGYKITLKTANYLLVFKEMIDNDVLT